MTKTIVAAFPSAADARRAFEDLLRSGHPRDRISVLMVDSGDARALLEDADAPSSARTAKTGAVVGGTLWGLGALALAMPPIAVLGAGPLIAALGGAGAGAAAGGLLGGLVGLGIPEHEAIMREEQLQKGGVLLAVEVPDPASERPVVERLAAHAPLTEFELSDPDRRSS